jgi:L-lactate dehydrogenase complex protein LldE
VIDIFEPYEYVVVPSGSCAGMLRLEYPRALADDEAYRARAAELAARTWELTTFLTEVLGVESTNASFEASVVFHDACAGMRELGIHAQPRRLLQSMKGLALKEMEDPESCCGFGGTFCVKFPEVSEKMVADKTRSISAAGASVLTGCDLGCLLNIAGRLSREGKQVRVLHVAEVLAGDMNTPGLGEADAGKPDPGEQGNTS